MLLPGVHRGCHAEQTPEQRLAGRSRRMAPPALAKNGCSSWKEHVHVAERCSLQCRSLLETLGLLASITVSSFICHRRKRCRRIQDVPVSERLVRSRCSACR